MQDWLRELAKPGLAPEALNLRTVVPGLVIALIFSYCIALIYKRVNRGRNELHVMMHTLVLLSVTIAAAMMIIGNNLARAFGLVGAVSIIRFRTAVKSSKDMAFVFLSIVIGMACGLGFRLLALAFTLFVGIVLLVMEWLRFGQRDVRKERFELRVKYGAEELDRSALETFLNETTQSWEFVGIKTAKKSKTCIYRVEVEGISKLDGLAEQLKAGKKKPDITMTINSLRA